MGIGASRSKLQGNRQNTVDKRIPLVIREVAYNLRGGFLVRPLIITLTLGCVGALLSYLEELVPGFSDFVPKVLFPSHSDPQVAQVILGGIAASIMTVVSIVFAILLMTDRKSTRLNSSHLGISYAVFCLKKKNNSCSL